MQNLPGAKSRAFVPTMGSLHAGHIALVAQAKLAARQTVASIFVNRLQFLPTEDFAAYPRTFEADCATLCAAGCDVLFAPDESELYPQSQVFKVTPDPLIADMLEGRFRPGFFIGVCTVVMKLFQCVQPSIAIFGKKDYQQLAVIQQMVAQFAMPIRVVAGETVRASDGLAMSSRNAFLSPSDRVRANLLSQLLQLVGQNIASNQPDTDSLRNLELQAIDTLKNQGWQPDYFSICNQKDLTPATSTQSNNSRNSLVILAAARLGKTRLIDQLEIANN